MDFEAVERISNLERSIKIALNSIYGMTPSYLKVIFNGPATILIVNDKKTVVKCTKSEKFDWEKGALMVMLKHKLPKSKWQEFTKQYHDTPSKEKKAAEAILRYELGNKLFDIYMAKAKQAWGTSQK